MIFYLAVIAPVLNHIAFKGSKVLMWLFAMQLDADQFIVVVFISLYSLFPFYPSPGTGDCWHPWQRV